MYDSYKLLIPAYDKPAFHTSEYRGTGLSLYQPLEGGRERGREGGKEGEEERKGGKGGRKRKIEKERKGAYRVRIEE